MNKKVLNTLLTIIVILILVIFCVIYYYVTTSTATGSIYDEVTPANPTSSSNIEETPNLADSTDLDAVTPFSGAFPNVDVLPILLHDGNFTEFSNEDILRIGFSNVTKEDWADTYQGEGQPVSIPTSLLDKYIKEIFGEEVLYTKANFSNTAYCIDADFESHTNSYDAVYESETDTYTINHIAGDGIKENYVNILRPMTSKIQDTIETEYAYVFVVYGDEMQTPDVREEGELDFEYIIYANCNYKTKTFTEELGRISKIDENSSFEGEIEKIVSRNRDKVQKFSLIYQLNEDGTRYNLKEIKK